MATAAPKKKSGAIDATVRVLILHGPEQMLQRERLAELRDAMAEAHGEVETLHFDGESATLADVLDEVRSFGLMQQHKIVIVDKAESFVSTHRAALERYAEGPVDHATLVLKSDTWRAGNLDKKVAKVGAKIECKPLSTAAATAWLVKHAAEAHHRKLERQAAGMLVGHIGCSLMRLDSELGKLVLLVEADQPITLELIEQVVGRGSDDAAYVVQDAVLNSLVARQHRAGVAITGVHEVIDIAGQPAVLVAYFIADVVRKLYEAWHMKAQGISEGQIAKDLKLWGERQQTFMKVLRSLDEPTLAMLLDRIIALDRRAKSGYGETVRNLECFCVELADTVQ